MTEDIPPEQMRKTQSNQGYPDIGQDDIPVQIMRQNSEIDIDTGKAAPPGDLKDPIFGNTPHATNILVAVGGSSGAG